MINKIENTMRIEVGRPQKKYEITVKDTETGEILYQNESFAGMSCTVEKVTSFGATMEGQHQVISWGHPMAAWYALDQMQIWFRENYDKFIDTLAANGVISGDIDVLKKAFRKKP